MASADQCVIAVSAPEQLGPRAPWDGNGTLWPIPVNPAIAPETRGQRGGDERDGISNASKMIRRTWRVGAREVAIGDGPGGIDGFDSVHSAWPAQLPHDPYEDNGSDHPTDDTPSSGNGVFEFLNNLSQKPLCLPNARPTLAQHAGASVDILDPDRQFPWIGRASRRAGHN